MSDRGTAILQLVTAQQTRDAVQGNTSEIRTLQAILRVNVEEMKTLGATMGTMMVGFNTLVGAIGSGFGALMRFMARDEGAIEDFVENFRTLNDSFADDVESFLQIVGTSGTPSPKGANTTASGASNGFLAPWFKKMMNPMVGIFKMITPSSTTALNNAMKGLGAMGPQMMALMLVTQPFQSMLEGFLEPLSSLSDIFGAFGEVLGAGALGPMMNIINQSLLQLMPLFQALGPIIGLLITPLQFLLIPLQLVGGLVQMFATPLQSFASGMSALVSAINPVQVIIEGVVAGWNYLTSVLSPIQEFLNGIGAAIGRFGNMIASVGAIIRDALSNWGALQGDVNTLRSFF